MGWAPAPEGVPVASMEPSAVGCSHAEAHEGTDGVAPGLAGWRAGGLGLDVNAYVSVYAGRGHGIASRPENRKG